MNGSCSSDNPIGKRVELEILIPSFALFPSDKVLYNQKSLIFISGQESNE
jgi:hypothetical protein